MPILQLRKLKHKEILLAITEFMHLVISRTEMF